MGEIPLWELHDVGFIEEIAYSTVPTSPSMSALWHNTISLEPKRDTLKSERRLGNRSRPLSRLGYKRVEGSAECELTAGNHDSLLEALLWGRFPSSLFTQISATTIAAVASSQTITDSGNGFGDIEVGDWIIVAGFAADNNNGVFHVSAAAAGSITVEYGSTLTDEAATPTVTVDQQNRLEALSDWEIPFVTVTGITHSAVAATDTFEDSGSGYGDIAIGDWIAVTGFTDNANNGVFEVTSSAAGAIGIDGALADEAAGDSVSIRQVISRSFTVEGRYQDQRLYHLFKGVMMKSGAFTLSTDNIVMVTFGMLGADFDADVTSIGTPTDIDATLEPFDCLGGTYSEGGTATTKMTAMQFSCENNNQLPKALGQTVSTEQSQGALEINGTVGFFLTSNTLIETNYWGETTTSFEVTLQDPDGATYTVGFPYAKIMDVDLKKTGDIEAVVTFNFDVGLDPTTGVQMYIVKA